MHGILKKNVKQNIHMYNIYICSVKQNIMMCLSFRMQNCSGTSHNYVRSPNFIAGSMFVLKIKPRMCFLSMVSDFFSDSPQFQIKFLSHKTLVSQKLKCFCVQKDCLSFACMIYSHIQISLCIDFTMYGEKITFFLSSKNLRTFSKNLLYQS